jgi:hypothetical protein
VSSISTTRAVERCERLAALGPAPAWWRLFALRRWLAEYRAIMALDISVGAQLLREVYPASWVEEMANQPNNTFLGIVKAEASEPTRRWIDPVDHQRAADQHRLVGAMTPEELALRAAPRSKL